MFDWVPLCIFDVKLWDKWFQTAKHITYRALISGECMFWLFYCGFIPVTFTLIFQVTSFLTIVQDAHKVESFFNKFVDYLIVTLLKMESTLTTLLPVLLRATNLDFFAYKTNGFIHIPDIDFIDRFLNLLQESR